MRTPAAYAAEPTITRKATFLLSREPRQVVPQAHEHHGESEADEGEQFS